MTTPGGQISPDAAFLLGGRIVIAVAGEATAIGGSGSGLTPPFARMAGL